MEQTNKILVVEDEVIVGMDLLKKLVRLDYQVAPKVIRYGEDVQAAVEKVKPDLVLMDIHLKGKMDGTQAAAIVQGEYGIPVIFLTAFSDQTTLSKAKESEPYAYLKKPVRMEELRINLELTLYKAKMDKERKRLTRELEDAFAEIKTLRGLIPICSQCKKIRDDQGYWRILECYIEKHSEARFSHALCPECSDNLYGDEEWYIEMNQDSKKGL